MRSRRPWNGCKPSSLRPMHDHAVALEAKLLRSLPPQRVPPQSPFGSPTRVRCDLEALDSPLIQAERSAMLPDLTEEFNHEAQRGVLRVFHMARMPRV
jgi:hypothetical protein